MAQKILIASLLIFAFLVPASIADSLCGVGQYGQYVI